uniref:Uncharacterized protein n=1 Tax=Arundo donax TaxID=35708 RepID=A0A0A9H8F1_ARUDO
MLVYINSLPLCKHIENFGINHFLVL